MTEKQMQELKGFIEHQAALIIQAHDEQIATLINVVHPGELEPCSYCGRLVTKPFRNMTDHGDDFCSPLCLNMYAEKCEDEVEEDARKQADAKIPKKHRKLWHTILGAEVEDGDPITEGECVYRGVRIEDTGLDITLDEDQRGGCQDEDGEWVEYHFAAADGTHILDCVCTVCKKEFNIAAHTLLKGSGHACPHCKGSEEGQ